MHSEICPVCQGKGLIPAVDVGDPMDDHDRKPCHGCNGKGWVEINDCRLHYIPFGDPPWPPISSPVFACKCEIISLFCCINISFTSCRLGSQVVSNTTGQGSTP